MIQIYAEGKKVKVTINFKYPVEDYKQEFSAELEHPVYAELEAENLNNHLRETIERIRKEEYEEGWKDAKSKKKKKTWFSQLMELGM